MKIDFNKMPEHARIWIYQANRKLEEKEVQFIDDKLEAFLPQWQSHGEEVKVAYTIKHAQFVILAIDQGFRGASGCSIDSSVNQIKELDRVLGVKLLNKMNIAYRKDDQIACASLKTFKLLIQQGEVTGNSLFFNNTVQTVKELNNEWEIRVENSWLSKYLINASLI